MAEIGYALSSEEHTPNDLVRHAAVAEQAGFTFAMISDHFHPWIERQGHSPFVWSVIGGISQSTSKLRLGTGVTCPMIRTHPAIIAQATATSAAMMPGRFMFGVGTGENLNEHILGDKWPPFDIRAEMLEESIEIIRALWTGDELSHYGEHYIVENARLYTVPDEAPPILVAASGPKMASLAGRIGDGLVATSADKELLTNFSNEAGAATPRYGQVTVCWNEDEAKAKKIAHEVWPTAALRGELTQELATPKHFEQAAQMVTEEQVAEAVTCGPDPERHIKALREYVDAGFDNVYVHQIGDDQEGFIEFYRREVLPAFQREPVGAGAA
jgi:G6PDH family F420-dependent oxidoreductase